MNLLVNTKYRTREVELMDDFSIDGNILHDTLDKLAKINRWLGGNKVTIDGLTEVLQNHPKSEKLTLVDLGCGGGDILRDVAEFGSRNGYSFELVGIDANIHTVNYAKSLSKSYPNIHYVHCDIFSEEFEAMKYDIILSTLFLHHFSESQLSKFLSGVLNKASIGIVVNDLHRNPIAYYLFNALCLAIPNKMINEDGLTSILKGFKRNELEDITHKIGAKSQIKWKWAFRYQCIIRKNK